MKSLDEVMRALDRRDGEARMLWRDTVQSALGLDDEAFRTTLGDPAFDLTRRLWRMAVEEARK